MNKSSKLCLLYLILITWNKAGHADGYGTILLYVLGVMIVCCRWNDLKYLKSNFLLPCIPIIFLVVISIIAWFNPQYRTITMMDLNDLNFEKVLLSSADSNKIEMASNAINLIIGQSKKDPETSLALFYYFKNRYQDKFGSNNKDSIYKFFQECEKKIQLPNNKLLPSCTIKSHSFFIDIYFLCINIFIGIALFYSIKKKNEIYVICYILFINCFILSIVGFYQISNHQWTDDYIEILGIWNAPEPRYYFSTFTYKNHWSSYALLMISCGLFLVRNEYHKIIKRIELFYHSKKLLFIIFTTITICFSILFSGSRSGILLLFITISICIYSWFRSRRFTFNNSLKLRIIKTSIFIPFIILLTFVFINDKKLDEMISISSGQLNNWKEGKAPLRILFWKDSLKMIQEKPFWGNGYNSFPSLYPKFQSYEVRTERAKGLENAHTQYIPLVAHAHNDILEIIVEWGLVGFFLIFSPFLIILLKFSTTALLEKLGYLGLGCVIFLLYCVIDFPTRTPACLATFSALFGISLKLNAFKKKLM